MAKNPVDMYKVIHMKTDDIFFFTVYLLQKMYAKILSLSIFKKRKSLNIKKVNKRTNALQNNKTS